MTELTAKYHIMDVVRAKFGTRISNFVNKENIYFDALVDCSTNELVYQVELFLLSNTNKVEDKIDVHTTEDYLEFPSSWWQHVRMSMGLSYKRKKYMYIKTHTTTKITYKTHLCSHMPIDPSNTHVKFLTFDQVKGR